MWMTIYNEKNVRKKIFLHFTLHNDKKTAENHAKSGDTYHFLYFFRLKNGTGLQKITILLWTKYEHKLIIQ